MNRVVHRDSRDDVLSYLKRLKFGPGVIWAQRWPRVEGVTRNSTDLFAVVPPLYTAATGPKLCGSGAMSAFEAKDSAISSNACCCRFCYVSYSIRPACSQQTSLAARFDPHSGPPCASIEQPARGRRCQLLAAEPDVSSVVFRNGLGTRFRLWRHTVRSRRHIQNTLYDEAAHCNLSILCLLPLALKTAANSHLLLKKLSCSNLASRKPLRSSRQTA